MSQFSGSGAPLPTPWYKENPFWGSIALCVGFLIAGVTVGITANLALGRWLLAFAWPWGLAASWLAVNGRTSDRRIRIWGRIAAGLVIGMVIAIGAACMGTSAPAVKPPNPSAGYQPDTGAKTQPASNTSQPLISKTHEPPIERTAKFSVMIPWDTAPNALPIPMDDNPDDPLFNTYGQLQGLAMNGTMPEATRETAGDGQVSWTSRPISTGEAPAFLGRLLQYYIFQTIDNLQHNSLSVYIGYPAEAHAGIEPPDAEPYSYKKLSSELAGNPFFRPFLHRPSGDDIRWKVKPGKFPRGTEIRFMTQKPDEYLVRFQRPAYFKADFIVQQFLGTGVGQIPKHFVSKNANTIMQWAYVVTMHYRIDGPDDDTFVPASYAQWLYALYDGLRRKLELDQSEKRSP
jgi:hypothetical protein